MKTQKMSLANIQGKLSRIEMKKIMAGSGFNCNADWCNGGACTCTGGYSGTCHIDDNVNSGCACVCVY
jgi:hypothetical protein